MITDTSKKANHFGGDAATVAADIAQHFQRARLNAEESNWSALCPCHDGHNASLSIGWDDEKVLVYCHAKCLTEDIMHAVGLRMSDLFLGHHERRNGHKVIVATYDYPDLQRNVLHQTVRYNTKDFKQRRPDPTQPDGWAWGLQGVKTVLYRLPELVDAVKAEQTIYLAEGEKDVDNLRRRQLAASTNPMGAGKWKKHFNQWLQGANVVILPDNDEASRTHAEQVARHLHGIAASVKVLAWPGLPEQGDVSDWLQAGGTREALEDLVQATPSYAPPSPQESPATSKPASLPPWQSALLGSKGGEPKETFNDLASALEHLEPWASTSWFDVVRDRGRLGEAPLDDVQTWAAARATERQAGIPIRNLKLGVP